MSRGGSTARGSANTFGNVGMKGDPGASEKRRRAVRPFELDPVDVAEQVLLGIQARHRHGEPCCPGTGCHATPTRG